jgi:hypothetical protein
LLATPDGMQLVLGMDFGLAMMGSDGKAGKELPIAKVSGHPLLFNGDDFARTDMSVVLAG